ncbi:hypothetical protein B566_EDAN001365 [Ephemera danica]|nr:hypothetical protein B566_EDAN001365 [Ephemera danica]
MQEMTSGDARSGVDTLLCVCCCCTDPVAPLRFLSCRRQRVISAFRIASAFPGQLMELLATASTYSWLARDPRSSECKDAFAPRRVLCRNQGGQVVAHDNHSPRHPQLPPGSGKVQLRAASLIFLQSPSSPHKQHNEVLSEV